MSADVKFIGYDKDGDQVWAIGPGIVTAADNREQAEWKACMLSDAVFGWRLADYQREFGPITERPKS